jgi:hypothetical protein
MRPIFQEQTFYVVSTFSDSFNVTQPALARETSYRPSRFAVSAINFSEISILKIANDGQSFLTSLTAILHRLTLRFIRCNNARLRP